MSQSEYRSPRTRRYSAEYEEDESGLRLVRKSGIPLLYVLAVCANTMGMICLGIITDYWSSLENPTCFLYAQSASHSNVYSFGSSLSNCYWVTYGPLVPTIIALGCGIFYMFGVFGDPADEKEQDTQLRNRGIILVAMTLASLLLLAVCCTLAEGMRITCTNMGLNAVNGKAANCMDKLNLRVAQYTLPVKTSTMVNAGSVGLWTGMAAFLFIDVFHAISLCRTY